MATDKLNKVLNRPLFRQQALKKGALKPVKAQFGTFVGTNPMGPKGVTVGQPYRNFPLVPAGPVIDRTPGMFQKGLGAIQRGLQGVGEFFADPTSKNFALRPRSLKDFGAGYGLYELGKGVTGSEVGGGLASIAGMFNPISRGAGMLAAIGKGTQYALDAKLDPKTNVLSTRFGDISNFMPQSYYGMQEYRKAEAQRKTQERKKRSIANLLTPPTTGDASGLSYALESDTPDFAYMSKEQQDKVIKRNAARLARETNISETKAANIVRAAFFKEVTPTEASRAVGDDAAYAMTVSNTYGDPKLNIPESKTKEQAEASEGAAKKPEPKKVDQPTKIGDQKIDKSKSNTANVDAGTSILGGGLIGRAREIYKELAQGRSSNANLVFLANLASGLLKGTTSKSGVGGALEVLGAALGPATSNYAIMKLKEDEINNKLMGEALDASAAELKSYAAIAAAQAKEGKAESFGAIQAIGPKGRIVNYQGLRTPTGGLRIQNPNGTFTDVAIGADLGNGFKVSQYIDMKANKEVVDTTKRALLSRIKSASYAKQSLDILSRDPQKAGAVGAFNLLTSRVGSALEDIGLGGYNSNLDQAKAKLKIQTEKMRSEADLALKDGEITQDEYDSLQKIWEGADKNVDKVIKRYKGSAALKDKDREELEQLAVNEVTLTYALANSFKDKDRLTARDVAAAKEIVNIFSWTRGSDSVKASLTAIKNNLERDILGYAKDLEREGVTQQTINALLADYDVGAFAKTTQRAAERFTPKGLDEIIGGIKLK